MCLSLKPDPDRRFIHLLMCLEPQQDNGTKEHSRGSCPTLLGTMLRGDRVIPQFSEVILLVQEGCN